MAIELFTLNPEGDPVPCADWGAWAQAQIERHGTVARTPVGPGYVSTIFVGWRRPRDRRDGPPLLFETMAIGIDGLDYEERHATRAEALAGHARAVEVVRHVLGQAATDAPPPPSEAA